MSISNESDVWEHATKIGDGTKADHTTDLLESDLNVRPPADVTALFDCYNTTLKQLVKQHVPVVLVTSYSHPTAPWLIENVPK